MSRDKCCHRHKFSGETTCDCGHDHEYKGKTTYAPSYVPHIHYVECCTSKDDGHRHYCCIPTGPAIPCPDGGHYHCIEGPTDPACGHIHYIYDYTSIED